jgi:putative NADH-flavin reductase
MKLLVLGATGGTGRQVVSQALAAGHDVTALARDRSRLTATDPRLRVLEGSIDGSQSLDEPMRHQDAVVCAIGRGKTFKADRLMQRSVPAILSAMTQQHVRRFLLVSALGVGDSYEDSPIAARIFFRTLLRGIYADKLIADNMVRASDVDWTIVQPSVLTDGPLTRTYRAGEHLALTGMPSISRADVAHYLVEHVDDRATFGKTIVLSD